MSELVYNYDVTVEHKLEILSTWDTRIPKRFSRSRRKVLRKKLINRLYREIAGAIIVDNVFRHIRGERV